MLKKLLATNEQDWNDNIQWFCFQSPNWFGRFGHKLSVAVSFQLFASHNERLHCNSLLNIFMSFGQFLRLPFKFDSENILMYQEWKWYFVNIFWRIIIAGLLNAS